MKNKIGVGVITCNREHLFKSCIQSVDGVDTLVVVNDGTPYPNECYPSTVKEVIQHEKNMNVAHSKNDALKYLIDDGCEHLFLMEDDVEVINSEVYVKYIQAAEVTGLWHLMFGYHGHANKDDLGNRAPQFVMKYEEGVSIAFHKICLGAFCYYHKSIIDEIGYMDTRFSNWLEHVEHTYRLIGKGMLPGNKWWPDLEDSDHYIWDLDQNHLESEIRKDEELLIKRVKESWQLFEDIHGVEYETMPIEPLGVILERLEKIKKKYAHKVL